MIFSNRLETGVDSWPSGSYSPETVQKFSLVSPVSGPCFQSFSSSPYTQGGYQLISVALVEPGPVTVEPERVVETIEPEAVSVEVTGPGVAVAAVEIAEVAVAAVEIAELGSAESVETAELEGTVRAIVQMVLKTVEIVELEDAESVETATAGLGGFVEIATAELEEAVRAIVQTVLKGLEAVEIVV